MGSDIKSRGFSVQVYMASQLVVPDEDDPIKNVIIIFDISKLRMRLAAARRLVDGGAYSHLTLHLCVRHLPLFVQEYLVKS